MACDNKEKDARFHRRLKIAGGALMLVIVGAQMAAYYEESRRYTHTPRTVHTYDIPVARTTLESTKLLREGKSLTFRLYNAPRPSSAQAEAFERPFASVGRISSTNSGCTQAILSAHKTFPEATNIEATVYEYEGLLGTYREIKSIGRDNKTIDLTVCYPNRNIYPQ